MPEQGPVRATPLMERSLFMRYCFVCLALICSGQLYSRAATAMRHSNDGGTNSLSMADLHMHLDDIKVTDGGLSFRFKRRGIRYKYEIGDKHSKIGEYGELIYLPLSQKMRVTSRDSQIVFQNVETNGMAGFLITRILDLRSIGRGRIVQNGFLVMQDQQGRHEKGCFLGINQLNDRPSAGKDDK